MLFEYKNKVLCQILCIILCILCGFLMFTFNAPHFLNIAYALELPDGQIEVACSAQSACVLDVDSGRLFYSKNSTKRLPMASTTKIVTAITAILNYQDLDTRVKISPYAVGVEGSSIYLKAGEMLSLRELLYGLMLRSGNDAAIAIAHMVAGGVQPFVEMMNDLAGNLNLKDSHFANPHGLDDPNHYTSAYDLAQITSFALNNPVFSEIVKTKNIRICEEEDNYRYLVNKNKLLFNMPDCIGVKTGYTKKAGRCLVSASEKDDLRVVCVVLNCGPMFEESKALLNAVQQKYHSVEILEPYHYYDSIVTNNGEQKSVDVYSRKGFRLPLSNEELLNINVEYDLPKSIDAPIKSEQMVGCVKVYYDKHLIFCENIYTIDGVKSRLLKDKVKDILNEWSI